MAINKINGFRSVCNSQLDAKNDTREAGSKKFHNCRKAWALLGTTQQSWKEMALAPETEEAGLRVRRGAALELLAAMKGVNPNKPTRGKLEHPQQHRPERASKGLQAMRRIARSCVPPKRWSRHWRPCEKQTPAAAHWCANWSRGPSAAHSGQLARGLRPTRPYGSLDGDTGL